MPTSNGNPYVGPRTFLESDRLRFFGREREARELLSLVLAEPLVLFYAQSGAGKSSLLNARLRPALRDEGFYLLPTGRVSGTLPQGVETVDNIFSFNLILRLDQSQHEPGSFSQTTLSDYLKHRRQDLPPEADQRQPWLLVIDQFEELFTTHLEHWEKREIFLRQLRDTLRDDSLLWIILSMREDYVTQLDPFARTLPGRLRTRFYMSRLTHAAALEAIEAPATEGDRPFAPGVAQSLVDNLRQIRVGPQQETHAGEFVEPVQLQVVCYQLWENLQSHPPGQITQQDLDELGDVDTALAQFYERTIEQVVQETGVAEIEVRQWLQTRLITESGTRGTAYRGPEQTEGLSNHIVNWLAANYLIRAEVRSGGVWYELVHDRFIDPILQANQRWRLKNPLLQAAQAWEDAGRDNSKLYEGRQLRVALEGNWRGLGPLVEVFLGESQAAQVAREATLLAERDAQRRRELEVAQQLAEEAEARRRAEAEHAREVEARAIEQARVAAQLRRRAWLLTIIGLVAAALGGLAALSGWQSQQYATQARQEQSTAQAASTTAIEQQSTAQAASTTAIEQQSTAQAASTMAISQAVAAQSAEETAIAAGQTAVAERNNAVQARADLAANLEGVLTAQAVTPTPLPTETVTPIIESEEDAPTPEIPTPTATQDQAATVTVAAVATQLAQVRATQTVIAAMPEVNGTLAIPLKQGDQYRVYLTGFDGQGMNGANPIRVNGHQPTFRRDGQRLIVISTDSTNPGVLSTNLQGTDIQRLIDRSSALWPAISPDGSEIVFADGSNGNQLQWWSADNGLSQVAINNFPIFTRNILWSTNNQLIFHTCENWNGRASDCGTWLSPANQLTPTSSTRQPAPERLLIGNDYFAMGADGNQFVYMARTDGDWEIYLYDLANRTERQLTTNEAQDGLPALSPDGRSIAYLSNESGSWALWTITLATGEKQRWFEINPQRGAVDLNSWADERISWTR